MSANFRWKAMQNSGEISAVFRENNGPNSTKFVCITFARYCTSSCTVPPLQGFSLIFFKANYHLHLPFSVAVCISLSRIHFKTRPVRINGYGYEI